jgi:SulP family sulfate permease
LPELVPSLWQHAAQVHVPTLAIGLGALVFLVWVRRSLKARLRAWGLGPLVADVVTKAAPVLALAVTTLLAWGLRLDESGLRVVGAVPGGLPPLTMPALNADLWPQVEQLALAALLISLVGFVESVSVGQSLAAKRRERIEPDAELRALGASNIAAGLTGGFPVTGGFSRSVVNFDAGARTPAAGVFTAFALLLAALLLTPALYYLPQATLAATIVVAVLTLVDFGAFTRTWRYARADFTALALTFSLTLLWGVEAGLTAGVSASLLLYLWRTSRPHIATVGRVPGTEHYRNVLRHAVQTHPRVLSLRVDESLYFANARYLEDHIAAQVAAHPAIAHVVLQCTAINAIDASALESLETIVHRLKDAGVQMHLSEVKGPVMDRLERSDFLHHLSGRVFLTHHQAISALTEEQP